ncbi:MAG: hypothetical protein ABR497_11285, partial [Kiritimatiellia bacterium]
HGLLLVYVVYLVSKVYAKQVATTRNRPNMNKTDYFFSGGLRVVATVRTFESNSIVWIVTNLLILVWTC